MFMCLYYPGRRGEEEKEQGACFTACDLYGLWIKMILCMAFCAFVDSLLANVQLGEY